MTIDSIQSTSYAAASTYVAATEEESTASSSASTAVATASYDTYTVSEEALAAITAEAESADTEVDTDLEVEDTDTDVEVEDTDTDVEVDEEDVEVEEEAEDAEAEDDSSSDSLTSSGNSYISSMDMKMTMMTNQMGTLSAMLSVFSDDATPLSEQSWVSDASTFSYAGRYLAKSAAGTLGVQLDAAEFTTAESLTTSESVEYFDMSSLTSSATTDSETE